MNAGRQRPGGKPAAASRISKGLASARIATSIPFHTSERLFPGGPLRNEAAIDWAPSARLPLQHRAPSTAPHPLRGLGSRTRGLRSRAHGNRGPLATRRHGNRGGAGSEARPLPPGSEMAAGAAELRRLQWRLEELEQRVGLGGGGCGPRKVRGGELRRAAGRRSARPGGVWGGAARRGLTAPSSPSVPPQVADELVKVQVALSNIAGKRERIKILFKKSERVSRKGREG